ncbi:MAG TPA: alpha/beta hydrolase [Alphaproteobacteria bacterium]|nr:alpha/beta hydrolase [Alphaproteobacteria bacterium]
MKSILFALFFVVGVVLPAFASVTLELNYDVINNQKIAYYDSKTDGETIVFIHGNSSSLSSFQKQLKSDLAKKYRLIAIDLPGHGQSQPAVETSFHGISYIVEQFLIKNGFDDGVVLGWSLGGHIVLEMAEELPNVKGFIVFGAPSISNPMDIDAFLPNPAMAYAYKQELKQEEMDLFVSSFFANKKEAPFSFQHDARITDGSVRAGIGLSIATGAYTDELNVVDGLDRPLAIFHGEDDELVNFTYLSNLSIPTLWRAQVQVIEDASHTPQYENYKQFNTLVIEFVNDITK